MGNMIGTGGAGLGYATKSDRPETSLENVISRLGAISGRLHLLNDKMTNVANTIIGYPGDLTTNVKDVPTPISTSITDYLREIENCLDRTEHGIGRLT